jgi:hypothetical protein
MASIISAGTTSGTALNMAGDTSGVLQLATNGSTTAITIDTSQNVGIGTTSPAQLLEVRKDQALSTRIKVINKTSSGSATAGLLFENSTSDVAQVQLWDAGTIGALTAYGLNMEGSGAGGVNLAASNGSGVIRFATGGTTERMRIDQNGAVMVGTTSAVGIFTATTLNATQRSIHASSNGGSTTTDGVYYSFVNQARGTGFNFMAFQNTSAVDFKVLGNGNVQNTNNSYGAISDVKLKENIVDATPKLDDLMKVKVRHYNFIDDELKTKQIGVVAQEVEQVFSGIVEEIPDRDEEGNTLDSVTKSVKYSVFVPMLIKAIQEQQTIINDLKARITALEGAA